MTDFHESLNGLPVHDWEPANTRERPPTLLVIEGEAHIVRSVEQELSSPQLRVISAGTATEGISLVRQACPDVVILDVQLPNQSGLDLFDAIRRFDPALPVIIMTAFTETDMVIDAMSRGAYEYLKKPIDFRQLRSTVSNALGLSRARRSPVAIRPQLSDEMADSRLIGHSSAMQEVYKQIGRIALPECTVLILGESGTGKELVARSIYNHSRRNHKPFLAINCAALSEAHLESELFGHEHGTISGTVDQRIGKFEEASGGTIFLDEIGDMSPSMQAKALRLIQDQRFERVGGNTSVKTNVRIIAATNRDLHKDVEDGRFRRDLLYRLNGFTIQLPPLRNRMEDIRDLANHFVALCNRELGKTVNQIAPEALRILEQHRWPGNIRELQNAIRYAVVHTAGDVLIAQSLPETCLPGHFTNRPRPPDTVTNHASPITVSTPANRDFPYIKLIEHTRTLLEDGTPEIYRLILEEVDRHVIHEVIQYCHGAQGRAANRLGISRMTLRAKLKSFGMLGSRNSDKTTSRPIGIVRNSTE